MTTKKIIAVGCGVVLLLGLLLVVALVLFVANVAKDPEGMSLQVDLPPTVKRGHTVNLVVTVINERAGQPLSIDSIDIDDEFLKGFTILSCEPAFTSSTKIPIDESHSYDFKQTIPAGGTNVFTFKLQARRTGQFSGELDVCEGMRFLTMIVETQVE
jgi:hypothetical protein